MPALDSVPAGPALRKRSPRISLNDPIPPLLPREPDVQRPGTVRQLAHACARPPDHARPPWRGTRAEIRRQAREAAHYRRKSTLDRTTDPTTLRLARLKSLSFFTPASCKATARRRVRCSSKRSASHACSSIRPVSIRMTGQNGECDDLRSFSAEMPRDPLAPEADSRPDPGTSRRNPRGTRGSRVPRTPLRAT